MRLEVSRFDYWTIWLLWCLGKFPASGEIEIGMDKPVPIADLLLGPRVNPRRYEKVIR